MRYTLCIAMAGHPLTKYPAPASFTRCADVWNALGRPIYAGEPGFRSKFDRDGDGVGCERDPR